MSLFKVILGGAKAIFGGKIPIIGDLIGSFTDGLKAKRDLKAAIELKKIERVTKLDTADIDWDVTMADASKGSWKDEYWTVVYSLPLWGVFLGFGEEVLEGFKVLDQTPDWYVYTLGVLVAASVGWRKISEVYERKSKPNKE